MATFEKGIVVINEQHKLMEDQIRVLDKTFLNGWETFPVPAEGWTRDEMETTVGFQLQEFEGCVVFASPIPVLIKTLTQSCCLLDTPWGVLVFHNDRRVAKEVPDGKGGVRVIHTVAPDGWELV